MEVIGSNYFVRTKQGEEGVVEVVEEVKVTIKFLVSYFVIKLEVVAEGGEVDKVAFSLFVDLMSLVGFQLSRYFVIQALKHSKVDFKLKKPLSVSFGKNNFSSFSLRS